MSIETELITLAATKSAIKTAIEDKGQDLTDVAFSGYADKISAITTGPAPIDPAPWVRPSDWLALPVLTESDNKFVGLHAIFENANFLALSAAGDYTVDWGDGVVENFSANSTAQHEYNYSTYDVSGSTLCSRGYKQVIVTVTPQAGHVFASLDLQKRHSLLAFNYVSGFLDIALAGASISYLKISAATQNISMACLEHVNIVKSDLRTVENLFYNCTGLKAITNFVTSTKPAFYLSPTVTDAGDLFTYANHGLRNGDTVIVMSVSVITGLTVDARYFVVSSTTNTFCLSSTLDGSPTPIFGDGSCTLLAGTNMVSLFSGCLALTTVPLFNTSAVTSMANMFINCTSLAAVPLLNTAAVTNMSNMFSSCSSLVEVPLLNTSAVTSMSGMFGSCRRLQKLPLFDTSAVTNMSNMFTSCTALVTIPLFDTSAVTNMNSMFSSCSVLVDVPLLNTSAVTSMNSMFSACLSLTSVPLLDTASVTSMASMFNSCNVLCSIPLLNTSAVTSMSGMFGSCRLLTTIPLLNTSAVTNMSSMFNGCYSLVEVPPFNTSAVTNMGSMFQSCYSIVTIPLLNTAAVSNAFGMFQSCTALAKIPNLTFSSVSNINSMFSGCNSLSRIQITGVNISFSVADCKLSDAALNEIYTNLPTVTGKTITVSGNYGTSGDNPSIATAKGWTVTG